MPGGRMRAFGDSAQVVVDLLKCVLAGCFSGDICWLWQPGGHTRGGFFWRLYGYGTVSLHRQLHRVLLY